MTITCQVCGTANPNSAIYCEGCGVELTDHATTVSETPTSSTLENTAPAEPVPAPTSEAASQTTMQTELATLEGESPAVASEIEVADAPVETPALATPSGEPVVSDSATLPDAEAPAADTPAADTLPPATNPEPVPVPMPTPISTPLPTPAATSAPAGEAKLGIKKFGAPTGDFIPLQGGRMVVGRFDASSGPVDIDLSGLGGQEHISRRHAELYRENGVWHVRDLGSTNGVYLKHRAESAFSPRLQEPAALADGDEIAFGNLMMTFHQS